MGTPPRTHRCVRWVLSDVPVVQPYQQFGCLVGTLSSIRYQYKPAVTLPLSKKERGQVKHRCVRWVLGDVPVV